MFGDTSEWFVNARRELGTAQNTGAEGVNSAE